MMFNGEKINFEDLPLKVQKHINDLNCVQEIEGTELILLHGIKCENYYSAIFESADKVIYYILEMYHQDDEITAFWITDTQISLLHYITAKKII